MNKQLPGFILITMLVSLLLIALFTQVMQETARLELTMAGRFSVTTEIDH